MDAATKLLLTTLMRGASICAVFQIKGAGVHRAKDSDSNEGVIGRWVPISSPTKKSSRGIDLLKMANERALKAAGQANAMLESSITLHKVIEGVELMIC